MKKRKKKSPLKTLQKENERLWKEACLARDGKMCRVQFHFPEVKIPHTEVYQVDHYISRTNKTLFLETSNGTVVCSTCNRFKKFQIKNVHRLIDKIVLLREGEDKVSEMQKIDEMRCPSLIWKSVEWHEDKKERLLREITEFGRRNE